MPVMRGQYAELLGPGLNMRTFRFRRFPTYYTLINVMKTMTGAYDDDFAMGGLGPLARKAELAKTILDEPYKIGGVRFIAETFALGVEISKEMRDDGRVPQALDFAEMLGNSSYWTQELYGHDVFNNGFTTAKYAGRDGLALFSTAHPLAGLNGTTVGNRPSVDTDLSEAALEAAILAYDTQVNDRGMPTMMRASVLLIHPSNRLFAKRLLNSELIPGSNNNDVNPLYDEGIRVLSDPWLTDPDAWFLIAPNDMLGDSGPRFYWRQQPDTYTWDENNGGATFHKIDQRHTVGFADWRGTYGSPGA